MSKISLFLVVFILDSTLAVPQEPESPPICPKPNQIWVSCLHPCPRTCAGELAGADPNPNCVPPSPCPSGCQCKVGYVLNSKNDCVLPDACCPGPNEYLLKCPDYCTFDDDCPFILYGVKKECPQQPEDWVCSPECRCKAGYIRGWNQKCVRPSRCCTDNDPNTVMVNCPRQCDFTCWMSPSPDCEAPDCTGTKGCRCKGDLVKDDNGKCIRFKDCPPIP